MTDELVLKRYHEGDENAILVLFREVFKRDMNPRYWRWRILENPDPVRQVALAWKGERLVGHYAQCPVRLQAGDEELRGELAVTVMAAPSEQGKGLHSLLGKYLETLSKATGTGLIWGFPNANAHRLWAEKFDWQDIHEVPTFRLSGEALVRLGERILNPSVLPVACDDTRFDGLWERAKSMRPLMAIRDQRYLSWRYHPNSGKGYETFALVEDGLFKGYVVIKRFGEEIDIVDILYTEDRSGVELVLEISRQAVARRAVAVNMWLNPALKVHWQLEKVGFQNASPVTYFCGKTLGSVPDGANPFDFRDWHLTMSDSDVY